MIDVWSGDQQVVDLLAGAQPWVNVLGNVSGQDPISSLSYRLNGGSPRGLSQGPNLRRLVRPGDFNADIARASLNVGTNTVEITAVDTQGRTSVKNVQLVYNGPASISKPRTIDWTQLSSPQQAVGIVDGKWAISGGQLRTAELGYDRMVSVGDLSWTDYEVEVPVTVHQVDLGRPFQSGSPLLGFIHRWNGHNNSLEPWNPGAQPFQGFLPDGSGPTPLGAMTHVRWVSNSSTPAEAWNHRTQMVQQNSNLVLQLGATYRLKSRVEDIGAGNARYSFKVWQQGTTEPPGWSVEYVAGSGDAQPQSGSLLLVAHEADVSFGTVEVRPITP